MGWHKTANEQTHTQVGFSNSVGELTHTTCTPDHIAVVFILSSAVIMILYCDL